MEGKGNMDILSEKRLQSHIDECNQRIDRINEFVSNNKDANQEECAKNMAVLISATNALEEYKNLKGRKTERWEKKHIPKKVIYEDVGYNQHKNVNVYACICPSCGLHIIEFDDDDIQNSESDEPKEMFHDCMVHHAYMGLNNYCNRCGQKLDWK